MKRAIGKEIWSLLKETFIGWHKDDASQLAAGLAFYAVCSAAPLLVIVVAIASLFFGQEAAGGRAAAQLESIVGAPGAQVFQTILSQARRRSPSCHLHRNPHDVLRCGSRLRQSS